MPQRPRMGVVGTRQPTVQGVLAPAGYEQITAIGTSTAKALSYSSYPAAAMALTQAEGDALRWRDDGTDPTSSVGMELADGDSIWYYGDLESLKVIATTGTGILNVSYYRYG